MVGEATARVKDRADVVVLSEGNGQFIASPREGAVAHAGFVGQRLETLRRTRPRIMERNGKRVVGRSERYRNKERAAHRRVGLLTRRARRLAAHWHATQVDQQGKPYLGHLQRVAARVPRALRPAAWLHDILEDTAMTPEALALVGIPKRVVATVLHVTRRVGEPWNAYIRRVAASGDANAVRVKLADLADNQRPGGRPGSAARYKAAAEVLQGVKRG